MVETLGVDFGGVIIERSNDREDTSFFSKNYLKTPAVAGAFEALRRLVSERFKDRVYLVSKSGINIQRKSRAWLEYQDFYKRTGIARDHVEFCLERRDKAGICERLGVTHFIDDRLEVLGYLDSAPNKILFHPIEAEVNEYQHAYNQVKRVESWAKVEELLLTPKLAETVKAQRLY